MEIRWGEGELFACLCVCGGGSGQHHIKKYGSREGNEAQSEEEEEAVCLSPVFKRVLNVVLSEMANLIMRRVFAGVVCEMFTTVFHGDCVGYRNPGITLAYQKVSIALQWES